LTFLIYINHYYMVLNLANIHVEEVFIDNLTTYTLCA